MGITRRRQLSADLLLLLVAAIWGGTFVMVKDATSSYPVYPFLAVRFTFATIALLMVVRGRWLCLRRAEIGAGVLLGILLFAGYALQTVGLQYVTASKAGLITGLSVVLVPILSSLLIRRAPAAGAIAGVVLATVGLGLLSLGAGDFAAGDFAAGDFATGDLATGDLATGGRVSIARGDLIVLGCALAFALHIVGVSVYAPRIDPLALTLVQVATVAILSTGISLAQAAPWPAPTPGVWFAAAFTGVLATALAFALQNSMQRYTTPTHTALIFTAEPVFAALFGVLLVGEVLGGRGVVGGVLIVLGTLVSEVPGLGRRHRRHTYRRGRRRSEEPAELFHAKDEPLEVGPLGEG